MKLYSSIQTEKKAIETQKEQIKQRNVQLDEEIKILNKQIFENSQMGSNPNEKIEQLEQQCK